MADDSTDSLKVEWMALFDRVVAVSKHIGANEALATLMRTAHAQLNGVESEREVGTEDSAPRRFKERTRINPAVLLEPSKKRAPSGSVQAAVYKVLESALTPKKVSEIVDRAETWDGERPKDTSVRMALQNLQKEHKVEQNELNEWSLTRREVRSVGDMPNASLLMQEAA